MTMGALFQDLRFAIRLMAESPTFTLVAVFSLALGIGANTAIFSVANALLFRPLPIKNPGEVVSVYTMTGTGLPYGNTSFPDYLDYRSRSELFSGLTARKFTIASIGDKDRNEMIPAMLVSWNYFSVVGVKLQLGRDFLPEEDQSPGASPRLIISNQCWQERFGSDKEVIGKPIRVNGSPFTIVVVAPRGFTGTFVGINPEIWVPIMMQ